ncbi:MAG: UDP-N-acetylglucosamine--N-acetylmuramyl-(pentapeptide) pyrophosphoryl-undecaprenol N-acetylglucosamine transferase [Planctomycetota bacterium]|nr:MAG: UDP-N-acetylglucosamine--N-acetylmuramyl-(pentapeptide) pyrophosphoryl-undecaprenol N-acetylglucosamine transferase [Planctomycetota bacterium]
MSRRAVLFAGGGTGGHILPAAAIAEHLTERDPATRVEFICSDRAIDLAVMGRLGAPFTVIPARPFGAHPAALARLAWTWGACVRAARERIRALARETGGVTVVATGGFVGPPVVRAALAQGARVALVNLDAVPGRANRWMARRASAVFTAFPIVGEPAWEVVGPIVRRSARPTGDAADCRRALGLDPDRATLVVLGGSQGAGTINDAMISMAQRRDAALEPWQIVHQTGDRDATRVARAYAAAGLPAVVESFFDPIGPVWGAADLVVARAGAGTVAEASAARAPCVFLPYPHHRDDHQRANAGPMVGAGAAIVLEDRADTGRNAEALSAALSDLAPGSDRLAAMARSAGGLGPADGAGAIADRLCR